MISKNIRDALNHQVNVEFISAYTYLSMGSYASCQGLDGVAHWFHAQAREEIHHGWKVYEYVHEQGEHVILEAIAKPESEFESAMHMFRLALENEQALTKRINELVELARADNDTATEVFLQWFVTEQVEEENQARHIIDMLNLAGDTGEGLFLVNKELSQRAFSPQEE
jgi:ferritin